MSTARPRLVHVDAFTARPFAGNPAAVVVVETFPDEAFVAGLVRELGLPATVFVAPGEDGAFALRWFTPKESDLCGHGTLAAAHALWQLGLAPPDAPLRFRSRSGPLAARREGGWILLDFPALRLPARDASQELEAALGAPVVELAGDDARTLARLAHEREVVALRPDLARLARIEPRGVIVTAEAAAPHDFVSRYFKPCAGIDEDPVTGSAHAALAPFWAERLGRSDFLARQASARGGAVRARLDGERVELGGQAVTVSVGELYL